MGYRVPPFPPRNDEELREQIKLLEGEISKKRRRKAWLIFSWVIIVITLGALAIID